MTARQLSPFAGLAAAVALAGCGITDPYSHSVTPSQTNNTETTARATTPTITDPSEPPPTEPTTTARTGVTASATSASAATARQALRLYTRLYINWTAKTIRAHQRQLAAISQGTARAAALQAGASYGRDPELLDSRVANTGAIVSIASGEGPEQGGWVIVTSEHTAGSGDYAGLPGAAHVIYAHVVHTERGWTVDRWSPQN